MSRKRLIRSISTISIIYLIVQSMIIYFDDTDLSRSLWLEHKNVKELIKAGTPERSSITPIAKAISNQHFWILRFYLLITIILTFYYRQKDIEKYTRYKCFTLSVIIILIAVSGVLTWSLKILVGKPRPFTNLTEHIPFALSMKYHSFPSGHTTETFSYIIPYIYYRNNKYLISIVFFCGILISFLRIILSYHYITDVIFGIYLTSLFGYIICYLCEKRIKTHFS
ncbi:MAG: phosphatase PAP2 family protein [Spirochaetota bacterium]|nr:phosphatase PAP2 family protein [Spirochaetota bacterium]